MEEAEDTYCKLPDTAAKLRDSLLDGYTCPPHALGDTGPSELLTSSERWSLKHWVSWKITNGTVQAYKEHGQNLQESSGANIISLYMVRKLASNITGLHPEKTDMCLKSCLAYTGEFETLNSCPYVKAGKICGEPRYKPRKKHTSPLKARAQMISLPIIPTIKALFANADTSKLMRNRDSLLKQTLGLLDTASHIQKFSDFGNGTVHLHHHINGLFEGERDIAFALSTDGAQLTMKKQSDTWILILELLNLPPELRYKASNVIIPLAIPGPLPPGNIESYV
ncbi:hypothetical protein FA95DRAFT_1500900, partial [Auriscalpium vulgare]